MASRWKDGEFHLPSTIIRSENMRHGIQLEHTELLQDDRAGYATVIQKINDIIKCLKEEEKSSWCDPDFGPTEEDEYGAFSIYWEGKAPKPVGNNIYPRPDHVRWERPTWDRPTHDKDEDGDVNEGDPEDDYEDDYGDEFDLSSGSADKWCTKGKLFKDGVCSDDVKQGSLGDCWFLSSLATLATQPDKLRQCFCLEKDPNKSSWQLFGKKGFWEKCRECGIIVCRFMKNFEWYYVLIDDRIPVNDRSGEPVFAHDKANGDELWVPLIEKAYAKLHGSYDSLIGGYIDRGLSDLTGMVSEQITLRPNHQGFLASTKRKLDNDPRRSKGNYDTPVEAVAFKDCFFKDMLSRFQSGSLMGCSIQPDLGAKSGAKVEQKVGLGLHMKHAYSIVGVYEVEYDEKAVRDFYDKADKYRTSAKSGVENDVENDEKLKSFFEDIKASDNFDSETTSYKTSWDDHEMYKKYRQKSETEKEKILRFVACRNPWGRDEWTGPWGDRTLPLFFRYKLREKRIDFWENRPNKHNGDDEEERADKDSNTKFAYGGDDGIFHMEYEDWKANFTVMFRCLDFHVPVQTGTEKWTGVRLKGEWTRDLSGGGVHSRTWYNNPRFLLTVSNDEKDEKKDEKKVGSYSIDFFMALGQEDQRLKHGRKHSESEFAIGFHIVKCENDDSKIELPPPYKNRKKPGNVDYRVLYIEETKQEEPKQEQPMYVFDHNSTCWCTLTEGKYHIIPSIFYPEKVGSFYLNVYGKSNNLSWTVSGKGAEPTQNSDGKNDLASNTQNDDAKIAAETKLKKDILFEKVREKMVKVAEERGIHITTLLSLFQKSKETDAEKPDRSKDIVVSVEDYKLTPKEFKSRLLELGFMNSDITTEGPNNDFSVLAGDDDLLSEEEFHSLFQQELDNKAMYEREKPPPLEDDLIFIPPPTEVAGDLYVNVVEARDLSMPNGWFSQGGSDSFKRRNKLLQVSTGSQKDTEKDTSAQLAHVLRATLSKKESDYTLTLNLDRPIRFKKQEDPKKEIPCKVNLRDCHALVDGNFHFDVKEPVERSIGDFQNGDIHIAENVPYIALDSSNKPTIKFKKAMYMYWDEKPGVKAVVKEDESGKGEEDDGNAKTPRKVILPYEHYFDEDWETSERDWFEKLVPSEWREVPVDPDDWFLQHGHKEYFYVTKLTLYIKGSFSAEKAQGEDSVKASEEGGAAMRPELALNDALINKSKRPDFKLAMDSGPTDESTGQSDEENNEGAGLPEKWIWSAGSVLIKKSLEKLDHAVKSDSPTDESTGQSDKENNENDDQPEKLESKLENAPAIRGEVETLVERHTSKIFKDKDKDRMTKFNKFAESTRRRRNFKRDDEDAHEIRYVDVIEVRNGRSRLLEPSEYLSKTKHDPNKNEEVLKSKGFTRKDTPVADSSFYYQVASFVKDFIFGRVFTVIDIIENVYDVQLTDSTSEGRTKSTVLKGRKAPVSTLENRSHVRDKGVIPIWQRCMRINGLETTLTQNDIESKDMLRWFDKFDSNKSGTIDFDEFSKALKSMGFHLHKREVKTLMERFDREGDGEIDYREFALWLDKTDTFVKRRTIAELLQIIKKIYTESLKDDPEFSDQELQLSPDRGVLTHFRGILKSGILTKLIRLRNEHASDKSDTHLIEIDVWNALLENELTVEELRRVARVFESRKQNLFNEYIKDKTKKESQEDEPTPTPAPTPALIKHQYVSYAWIPPATKSSSHQTTASMPLLSLSDQSKEDEKASDPMKLSGTRKLARKSLEALGSVAGQVRQGVDVTEAFKKFPVTRRKNNTIVRFSDFSDTLLEKMKELKETSDVKVTAATGSDDAKKQAEITVSHDDDKQEEDDIWYIGPDREIFPAYIKLRMLLDDLCIENEVACSDLSVLMKGEAVQHIEEKLRYLLRRKTNSSDGVIYWMVTIGVDRERKNIIAVARDPETQRELVLSVPEDTTYLNIPANPLTDHRRGARPADLGLGKLEKRGEKRVFHIQGDKAGAMEKYMKTLVATEDKLVRNLHKVFNECKCLHPVFVQDLQPCEEKACRKFAQRLLINRNPTTGDTELILGESQEFIDALQDAFAENSFDFFINVTSTALTFRVNKNDTGRASVLKREKRAGFKDVSISGAEIPGQNIERRKTVLESIRSAKRLRAYLSGTSSVLQVVFESSDGHASESMSWKTFVAHLENMRNPYVSVEMLPKHPTPEDSIAGDSFKNFYQRTKADKDGGSQPWFNTTFKVPYRPSTNALPTKHTDVMHMGFSRSKQIWKSNKISRTLHANEISGQKLFEMIGMYIGECPKEDAGNFDWLCEQHESKQEEEKAWEEKAWVKHIAPVSPHLLPTKTKHQIYESVCSTPGKGEEAFEYWSDHNLFELDKTICRYTRTEKVEKNEDGKEVKKWEYKYKKYTWLAGEKKVRGSKAVWIMRDPRYVVVSVRRDHRTGLLCATAYDSRTANEYEVEGPEGWQKNWNLTKQPDTRETNAKPPFLTGRPHHPGTRETPGETNSSKNEDTIKSQRWTRVEIDGHNQDYRFSTDVPYRSKYDEYNWQQFVHGKNGGFDIADWSIEDDSHKEDEQFFSFVDKINTERWEWLKRHVLYLGKQITPRLALTLYTAPLSNMKGAGGDQYIGNCEIPISLICSLGHDIGLKWFKIYRYDNLEQGEKPTKAGEIRLKYSFSTSSKNKPGVTFQSFESPTGKKVKKVVRVLAATRNSSRTQLLDTSEPTKDQKIIMKLEKQIKQLESRSSRQGATKDTVGRNTDQLERDHAEAMRAANKLAMDKEAKRAEEEKAKKSAQEKLAEEKKKSEQLDKEKKKLHEEKKELLKKLKNAEQARGASVVESAKPVSINGAEESRIILEKQNLEEKLKKREEELARKIDELERKVVQEQEARQRAERASQERLASSPSADRAIPSSKKLKPSASRPMTASPARSSRMYGVKRDAKKLEKRRKEMERKMKEGIGNDEEWDLYQKQINGILRLMGKQLIIRNPADKERPLKQLQKLFELSANEFGVLAPDEFRSCLQDFNVFLEEKQLKMLMLHFDYEQDGQLDIEEIMMAVRASLKAVAAWGESSIRESEVVVDGDEEDDDDSGLGPLPKYITKLRASTGRFYFKNHRTKTTSWDDPRITSQPVAGSGVNAVKGRKR